MMFFNFLHRSQDFVERTAAELSEECNANIASFVRRNRAEDRKWAVEQAVIGGTPTDQIPSRAEAILDYLHPMPEQDNG